MSDTKVAQQKLMPKVNEIHQLIKGFHGHQITQFQQMVKSIEGVQEQLREKQEECENYINEIKTKRKDHDKLSQLSQGVLKGKSDQIKSKVKNIDAVSTGLKQSVGKIKTDKLIKLPVNEERNLKKMFETIYTTVYTETKQPFNWETFKKLALKHEDGEDFISRLVNINFKDLSPQKYDKLLELKNDPEFANFTTKSKYSYDIIDLADWVDYTCVGHQYYLQKIRAEKDYDKIRKDIEKKSKGSLQMSENYWKEASTEIEGYQNQIQSVNSELRTILFGLKKSVGDFTELEQKTKERLRT